MDRRMIIALAVGFAGACRTTTADDRAGSIATVGGVELTERDATELASQLSPPPSPAEASRLVVDAALAQWLVRGYVAPASGLRRLASYRELLVRVGARARDPSAHARAVVAYLARAAERIGVAYGPCFEPAAIDTGRALPAVTDDELAAVRATPRSIDRRLAERARGRPVVRAILWRLWPTVARIELGAVLADELEPGLAAALIGRAPGTWTGPVTTRTGTYLGELR